MNEHREKITEQRNSPHYGDKVRNFFYGPPGKRVSRSFLYTPLGNNFSRLEEWAREIRQKEISLQGGGFASDFLKERLEEEKQKWQAALAVLKKHGSAP